MDFANGRQVRSGELGSEANQCAPEMPVDKGHLASHEPADQNVRVIADRAAKPEYLVGTRMGPSIAVDRRTRNRLGQTGDGPADRLRNDAALFNEVYGLFFGHLAKQLQRVVSGAKPIYLGIRGKGREKRKKLSSIPPAHLDAARYKEVGR